MLSPLQLEGGALLLQTAVFLVFEALVTQTALAGQLHVNTTSSTSSSRAPEFPYPVTISFGCLLSVSFPLLLLSGLSSTAGSAKAIVGGFPKLFFLSLRVGFALAGATLFLKMGLVRVPRLSDGVLLAVGLCPLFLILLRRYVLLENENSVAVEATASDRKLPLWRVGLGVALAAVGVLGLLLDECGALAGWSSSNRWVLSQPDRLTGVQKVNTIVGFALFAFSAAAAAAASCFLMRETEVLNSEFPHLQLYGLATAIGGFLFLLPLSLVMESSAYFGTGVAMNGDAMDTTVVASKMSNWGWFSLLWVFAAHGLQLYWGGCKLLNEYFHSCAFSYRTGVAVTAVPFAAFVDQVLVANRPLSLVYGICSLCVVGSALAVYNWEELDFKFHLQVPSNPSKTTLRSSKDPLFRGAKTGAEIGTTGSSFGGRTAAAAAGDDDEHHPRTTSYGGLMNTEQDYGDLHHRRLGSSWGVQWHSAGANKRGSEKIHDERDVEIRSGGGSQSCYDNTEYGGGPCASIVFLQGVVLALSLVVLCCHFPLRTGVDLKAAVDGSGEAIFSGSMKKTSSYPDHATTLAAGPASTPAGSVALAARSTPLLSTQSGKMMSTAGKDVGDAPIKSPAQQDEQVVLSTDLPPKQGEHIARGGVAPNVRIPAEMQNLPPLRRDGVAFFGSGGNSNSNSANNVVQLSVQAPVKEQELFQGLMYRTSLPENGGMAFLWSQNQIEMRSIYMHNTLIDLDVIWCNSARGQISHIATLVKMDLTHHYPSQPSSLALEAERGWAAEKGLKVGDACRVEWKEGVAPFVWGKTAVNQGEHEELVALHARGVI